MADKWNGLRTTRNMANINHSCRPGVDITINYHPGFEATALAALDAAYADVRAQITGRAQEDQ